MNIKVKHEKHTFGRSLLPDVTFLIPKKSAADDLIRFSSFPSGLLAVLVDVFLLGDDLIPGRQLSD